jgi:predicted alpha/beta-fold hydrolase
MFRELSFNPFPLIADPHRQTILAAFLNFLSSPSSKQKLVRLPDGDHISLEITTPEGWKGSDPTVMLVHGLCGSHKAPNISRMARRLELLGVRSICFNMRGCGSGKGLARQIYHGGKSEDLFECLKVVKKEHPDSPITLIGYSLGGNVSLKMVGELGSMGSYFLNGVIAVSPPVELDASAKRLLLPENAMYNRYFYRVLRAMIYEMRKVFRDLPSIHLPKDLSLYEFDRIFTIPTLGFSNVSDYYHKCSSAHLIGDITIPCRILVSRDDPIIDSDSLDAYHLPKNIEVFKTNQGGHMGYLGFSEGRWGFYWLDSVLLDWIKDLT